MQKPLIVYKASAGSGKTFTLSVEYIKLLIRNPYGYRNILAVTFTNKATDEMKRRILSQLYGIWKGLDDSKAYLDVICRDLDASPAFVSRQAGIALGALLHNYSYFTVETIDAFFQNVLRNLARELNLTANLRIELNDRQVEEMAVDKVIEELNSHSEVLQWILKYIYANISEDKSWNVIGQIKKFGLTIFKDYYKEVSAEISDVLHQEGFFDSFTGELTALRKDALERMKQVAASFFDALQGENLTVDDLVYKKGGVAGFFIKLSQGFFDESIVGKRVVDALENPDKWTSKTSPRRYDIKAAAESQFIPLLRYGVDERPQLWENYKSADLTLKHIDQLRLLETIERKVRELNEASNRFLLSDTQTMLHAMIRDSDSPFIFEKIGTRLEHIMIDEFQDTSTVQWQNFKLLLEECMSHEDSSNLIVGDVKQSIYRWRAGDWRLLNDIEKQFPRPGSQLQVETLTMNYRSQRNIIDFNNAFFTEAAEAEAAALEEDNESHARQLRTAYKDVVQRVPDSRQACGMVEVELLPADEYQQNTLRHITDTLTMLLNSGVRQNNIAILVRNNKYIPLIATQIMDALSGVQVVSSEAFRLDASTAVNIIVNALRLVVHPEDTITEAVLVKAFQLDVLHNELTDSDLFVGDKAMKELLPEAYAGDMASLARMPLYELAERVYNDFQLSRLEGQGAYVCAFYDQLSAFTEDNFSDIEAFLREWDRTIAGVTVNSEELDGIRIMSIHKSKGLEFDNVILPFCDWQLEHNDILWCKTGKAPYNQLPIIPVDTMSRGALTQTVFADSYLEEHFQNTVDNLNLLYVAFTRAGHNLFVYGKKGSASTRSRLLQTVLPTVAGALGGAVVEGDDDDKTKPMTFSFGELYVSSDTKKKTATRNVFLQPSTTVEVDIESLQNKVEFRQSNQSRDFIDASGDDDEGQQAGYIKAGKILHSVFATIETRADIDKALFRLELDGVLYDTTITAESIRTMLRKRLEDPRVADWFSGRWRLFNECTILSTDPATGRLLQRRPDRVMTDGREMIVVDFKFGRQRPEYFDQVKEYMELLSGMGYENITGYLWFVYTNKIVDVAR